MKTKMNKRIRLTSLILCFTLLLSVSTYAAESKPDIVSQDIQNNLVDVVLDSSDERYIVVSVPQDKAEEYKNQIETDQEFREAEMESALGAADTSSRALPPGKIVYQKKLNKKAIKKAVDAVSGTGAFANWYQAARLSMNAAEIKKLIKLSKKKSIFALSADIFVAAISYIKQQQKDWWVQAYIDIMNKKISAVRYTIIENPTEYPKIWRVFERI